MFIYDMAVSFSLWIVILNRTGMISCLLFIYRTSRVRQEGKGKFGVYFVYVLFLHLKRHDV